ncbi:hypothetical protein Trco_004651 [Trichoderma cornu-damae]|uniref:Uncharacterized protein n=1 Tax=Trichoderma cornu-damae TaxID=654480 RepID=A0A9P8TUM5_9HYPO|nr:hypothetical protein Trco_004651 [Trichoderma cornu-damae]
MSLDHRLRSRAFTPAAARDALNGVSVPQALGREVMRACVVRGIRYHAEFSNSPGVQELRSLPIFARAINARAIMSNIIPEAMAAHERPYCIWYPETASEETYRQLARRYPDMAYHAVRACAVAGYTSLYQELVAEHKLVPEVAVAEEARACGSKQIYEAIVGSPMKYAAMDDYTRSVLAKPRLSGLNGDVAVRPMLEMKQKFRVPTGVETHPLFSDDEDDDDDDMDLFAAITPERGFRETTFNITEDWGIGEVDSPQSCQDQWTLAMAEYLAQPLPADLPLGNKDILILAAAHMGNIDRYARLRRPTMVNGELACVVRGIYQDHFFATWWASQQTPGTYSGSHIVSAFNARMIMSNDLSRLSPDVPKNHQPYLIWYPDVAQESTYRELARRLPSMKLAVVHASIYCDYRKLFDLLLPDIEPDPALLQEAKQRDADGHPSYYTAALLTRAGELGLEQAIQDVADKHWATKRDYTLVSVRADAHTNGLYHDSALVRRVPTMLGDGQHVGIYNGVSSAPFDAYLWASVPRHWLPKEGDADKYLDYEEWPPREV